MNNKPKRKRILKKLPAFSSSWLKKDCSKVLEIKKDKPVVRLCNN
jgi:hypothetical protein